MKLISRLPFVTLAGLMLAACATPRHNDADAPTLSSGNGNYADGNGYGRVASIQAVTVSGSNDPGMGTVIGGLVGGLIANQLGSGNGRMLATAAGAGGGAMIGYQMDKTHPREIYKIRVQLDSGDYQTVSQDNDADLSVGNRVHIDNGRVYRY
jgi:outer membrane lipoprotein SlyB